MIYKAFRTYNNRYLYDRQENRIVKINDDDYECFLELEKGIESDKSNEVLERYRKYGLCKENELLEIKHPRNMDLGFYLGEHMENIVLQVTQDCNLRCSYCTYSGKYNNRRHAKNKMSYDTASKAIDFYVKHSRSSSECNVGFYGGEPLLEFKLIKKIISYIEENYQDKAFRYNITTNGTLLFDDVVDFLVDKNFSIMISIDGPKNIQNENRCFVNGAGSFDIVINNLSKIKSRYPDYYHRIMTNTVLSPNQDFGCVQGFLLDDDIMQGLLTGVSLISDTGTNEIFRYDEILYVEQRKEELRQMLIMLGELDGVGGNKLFGNFKNEFYKRYVALSSGCFHCKKGHPGGPCIAGAKKTFVDVLGNLYPCEKLPELEEMRLGNIETGIQQEKVEQMINIARITEKQCKDCWAFIFCYSCVALSVDANGISKEKRLRKCIGIKKTAQDYLEDIMRFKEYGFNFDSLK